MVFCPLSISNNLRPDAAIAIAALKTVKKNTQELFNGTIGWVEWKKPGFELGPANLKQCLDEIGHPSVLMLGSHWFIYLGRAAYESYVNTLEVI